MKKALILSSVLMALLFCGSQAMAASVDNETTGAGKQISLEAGQLNLNFSPSVYGQYTTDGTDSNEQWYAIGTYHSGGNTFYATSQQQTTVWKKDRTTVDDDFADAAIPVTKTASDSAASWTTLSFSSK
jgi:hypothetical protein